MDIRADEKNIEHAAMTREQLEAEQRELMRLAHFATRDEQAALIARLQEIDAALAKLDEQEGTQS